MIKHLLTTIWNERRSNIALVIELFIISTFLWFVIDTIYPPLKTYLKPLGYSVDNVYVASMVELTPEHPDYDPELTPDQRVEALNLAMERIRRYPEVAEAGYSIHARPEAISYNGRSAFVDTLYVGGGWRIFSPEALRVYQYEEENGDNEKLIEALERGKIIISHSSAELLRGANIDVLNAEVYTALPSDSASRHLMGHIGAVAKDVRHTRFSNYRHFFITPLTNKSLAELDFMPLLEINIKPKAGYEQGFEKRFKEAMTPQLQIGNFELDTIDPLQVAGMGKFEGRSFQKQMITNGILLLFLLVNILLGVSGVFWYRTLKRKSQMGLRIALGDTPHGVLRKYFAEGLLLLSIGFLLSIAVFVVLYEQEVLDTSLEPLDTARFIIGMVLTYLLMAGTIILSIWLPARKIIRIPPADTLKEE